VVPECHQFNTLAGCTGGSGVTLEDLGKNWEWFGGVGKWWGLERFQEGNVRNEHSVKQFSAK
jgi:hypothetical protein